MKAAHSKAEFCSRFQGYLGLGILNYCYYKLCVKNNLPAKEYKSGYEFNINGGMYYLIMHPVNRCRNKLSLINEFIAETKLIEKKYEIVGSKVLKFSHSLELKNKLTKKDYNDFWRNVNTVVKTGLMNEYKNE